MPRPHPCPASAATIPFPCRRVKDVCTPEFQTLFADPHWLHLGACNHTFSDTRALVEGLDLHTVCHSAKCPNMFECFSRKTATFLILGNTCTRNCAFCNIGGGIIHAPDPKSPRGQSGSGLGLRHAVVASVTRDITCWTTDRPTSRQPSGLSGTAAKPAPPSKCSSPTFAATAGLQTVMDAEPPSSTTMWKPARAIQPQPKALRADISQSLELLRRVKEAGRVSKSGLMVGLGETDEEVHGVLADLAAAGCDIVTIGQYMRPSQKHHPVERYVHPDIFESYAQKGRELGIPLSFSARCP